MLSQMNSERYQQVKEILAAALEIEPGAQAGFLRDSCAGDLALLAEVESLFKAYNEADSFLEDFSVGQMVKQSADNNHQFIGQLIDNYRIVSELGRGGMGVVFLATREDFHQQAAVKLIKRGMDSDAILERFVRERKILAALSHPFIAMLLDGGTTAEGAPFFVMEYVEGIPINDYCEKNNLSSKGILKLFLKVCEATAFAHQKLIVHRDLKPSNILVTADGTPKLLDFGIAKLLNATDARETQTSQRALTPAYASPEQIRGAAVDTTSDVYSLGKILAELLQGSPQPLNSKETDKSKSRRTNNVKPALPADLEAVLQTALREETGRRYPSVEKFADDLRRYQNGLPISACLDTFVYRAKKFLQRNALAASLAGLCVLSLIGGLVAEIWQAHETSRQREFAEQRFDDVRQLANSVLFELHDAVEDLPGSTPARKLIVERALEYLDKLSPQSGGDPALQRELAAAYEKIGKIQGNSYYSNLGDSEGAMKSYQRSLEIRQNLAAANPNSVDLQKELSDSQEGVGDMYYTQGDLASGLQSYENSLAIRQKVAAAAADNLDYQAALAAIYSKIGDITGMEGYASLGDTGGALENYQKAVVINKRLSEIAPDNAKLKMNYAERLANLGILYRVVGKTAESLENLQRADEIYYSLLAQNPDNATTKLNILANNAILRAQLVDNDENDQAIELLRRSLGMIQEMQQADPKNTAIQRALKVYGNYLSVSFTERGDFDQALAISGRSLKIAEELSKKDAASEEQSEDLANTLRYLADAQFGKKDFKTALANYRRAIEIHQKLLAADSSDAHVIDDLTSSLAGAGKTEAALGNFDAALKDFNQAIPATEEAVQKSPVNTLLRSRLALRYLEIGEIYQNAAQKAGGKASAEAAEAVNYFQKSADIWSRMQQEGILNKADAKRYQRVENEKKIA